MQDYATSKNHGPISILWKTVSEDCNLACDYCYYSRVGGKIGPKVKRIDSKLLEKCIKEYMELTNGVASFAWQGGEPLLGGIDFFEEVVYLQAKYAPPNTVISNAIQTNATLLNGDWARFFKKYNFLVGVSIDGPKAIHDARRVTSTGAGSFDRVMRGVRHLRENDVDFNILTVIHEGNVTKARELMEFYNDEGFQYLQFIPCMDFHAQEIDRPPKYLITPAEYGQFLCDAFDIWYNAGAPNISVRFFDNILRVYLNREAEICIHRSMCPTTLILEQNGDAYPCDFFIHGNYKLGNVGIDSLEDILGNRVYQNFLMKKPALPQNCKSCEYVKLCHGGCPRNRTWGADDSSDVDYFCESYFQIYQYAHKKISTLATRIRVRELCRFMEEGHKLPGRNEPCICGSGLKFKKCCEPLKSMIGMLHIK